MHSASPTKGHAQLFKVRHLIIKSAVLNVIFTTVTQHNSPRWNLVRICLLALPIFIVESPESVWTNEPMPSPFIITHLYTTVSFARNLSVQYLISSIQHLLGLSFGLLPLMQPSRVVGADVLRPDDIIKVMLLLLPYRRQQLSFFFPSHPGPILLPILTPSIKYKIKTKESLTCCSIMSLIIIIIEPQEIQANAL